MKKFLFGLMIFFGCKMVHAFDPVTYVAVSTTPVNFSSGSYVVAQGAGLPAKCTFAGRIMQVVTASTQTEHSSTSVSYADTGLTLNLTPLTASSTIYLFVNQSIGVKGASGIGVDLTLRLLSGSTAIQSGSDHIALDFENISTPSGSYDVSLGASIFAVDTTMHTAGVAITYKTQFARSAGSGTAYVQHTNNAITGSSTIWAVEIGNLNN